MGERTREEAIWNLKGNKGKIDSHLRAAEKQQTVMKERWGGHCRAGGGRGFSESPG